MTFDFSNTGLNAELTEKLMASLTQVNAELDQEIVDQAERTRAINAADDKFSALVKQAYDTAIAAAGDDDVEAVRDILIDQIHDIGYDWCSGRPLEFEVDDGKISFWEPSTC